MLELVLVLVIIGVVSAVVVPRFGASVARYRLEAAAQRVTADLRLVRQRAQQASLAQTIVFDAVADTYGVATMPDPDHPNGTYLVRLDRAPYEVNLVSADFGGEKKNFPMDDSDRKRTTMRWFSVGLLSTPLRWGVG